MEPNSNVLFFCVVVKAFLLLKDERHSDIVAKSLLKWQHNCFLLVDKNITARNKIQAERNDRRIPTT